MEGTLLTQLGDLSLSLFEYAKAKDYLKERSQSGKKKVEERKKENPLTLSAKPVAKLKNTNRQKTL